MEMVLFALRHLGGRKNCFSKKKVGKENALSAVNGVTYFCCGEIRSV